MRHRDPVRLKRDRSMSSVFVRKRSGPGVRIWMVPVVYTLASLAAAALLPRLEHAYLPNLLHSTSPAAAMAFLSATASGILAFTAIVFSLAFVMVQFSAMAYSPRLVRMFAGRPILHHALGIFIATFTYALATLLWTDRGGDGVVPFVSMTVVICLLIASMISFALLIQSVGSLQITEVLNLVGDQGRAVIAEQGTALTSGNPAILVQDATVDLAPLGPCGQVLLHVGVPRTITRIDWIHLAQAAARHDAVIALSAAVGDTLVEGTPILQIFATSDQMPEDLLRRTIHLGRERTFEQDPTFALRILVDIAIKALSPAINDPTTAVQALDQIDDLLRRLAQQELGSVWFADPGGTPRLFVSRPVWEDYLSLAFDEIRQFGMTSVQIMRRLRSSLLSLETLTLRQERGDAVRKYLAHLDGAVDQSALDPLDRATARQADPQGLGFARAAGRARADSSEAPASA
jgi:uncharacterized membrane protein